MPGKIHSVRVISGRKSSEVRVFVSGARITVTINERGIPQVAVKPHKNYISRLVQDVGQEILEVIRRPIYRITQTTEEPPHEG